MDEIEIQIYYPPEWEDEYKRNGAIAIWSQEFPEMFDGSCGTHKPPYARTGTLENFPNYALMYLLQKNHGVHSITYFRLGSKASKDGNRLQVIMRKWMGDAAFEKLRSAIQADPKLWGKTFAALTHAVQGSLIGAVYCSLAILGREKARIEGIGRAILASRATG